MSHNVFDMIVIDPLMTFDPTGSSNGSNESSSVDNGNDVDGEDKDEEEEEEALLSALTTNMLKSHCEPQHPTQVCAHH